MIDSSSSSMKHEAVLSGIIPVHINASSAVKICVMLQCFHELITFQNFKLRSCFMLILDTFLHVLFSVA